MFIGLLQHLNLPLLLILRATIIMKIMNESMKYNKNGLIASITMDIDMSTLCAIKGQFNAQTHGP